jgi:hypothetical protein
MQKQTLVRPHGKEKQALAGPPIAIVLEEKSAWKKGLGTRYAAK